jgi:glycosyltransferase involved in cell wall biosynthesis
MRVLLAHNRYRLVGGEDRHVALLRESLDQAGIETQLFEPRSDELTSSLGRRLTSAALLAYRPGGGGIGPVLEQSRPDIVHFHNIWPLLTPAALRLSRRAGAAVVLTLHNTRFACPGGTCTIDTHPGANGLWDNRDLAGSSLVCAVRHNPRGAISESIAYGFAQDVQRRLQMLGRWVDAFIAPSEYVAQMLELTGVPMDRVTIIPNGVSVPDAPPPAGSSFALYAGRLSAEKGIDALIEAARAAPEVPVAAAGTGPLLDRVKGSPIRHLGQLAREDLDRAMEEAAFTILPSACHENQPYGALESLAAGRAVIATKVGGLPEIVRDGKTGLIVPPASPTALAGAIRGLWDDPELSGRLGTNGFADAHDRFRLELQIERTLELYRSLR